MSEATQKRPAPLHVATEADIPPEPVIPPSQLKRWKDPSWKYVPKDESDIRARFERMAREQKRAKKGK